MLLELSIENYALVRSLRIEFGAGLSAITGESGAGKSLLLGALGQVLGGRADTARISPEKTSSHISARFDLSDVPAGTHYLAEHGLDNADASHECLLHRRIDISGRSRAYVNNVSVTLSTLRELAALLVDIHAQDQHHALRSREVQQQIFDEYAASVSQLRECASRWQAWQRAKTEAEALATKSGLGRDRTALLKYQVEELDALNLDEGEYEHICEQHARLSRVDELRSEAGYAIHLLDDEHSGLSTRLAELAALLERMRDDHQSIASAREAVLLATSELSGTTSELTRYIESMQADPHTLKALDERISTIVGLARKHRVSPETLSELAARLRAELGGIEDEDGALEALRLEENEHRQSFQEAATVLSEKRASAVAEFESRLRGFMQRLGLGTARITVTVAEHEHECGFEKVAFNYAASEALKATPLEKVASGGERSRLALAVALLAAEHSRLPSLILDEADVGIGGRLSDEVGDLLASLGDCTQILMITHAPQVAALASAHYRVMKSEGDAVSIVRLGDDARLDEVSRMLGGAHLADSTREYARKLLASRQS